LALASLTGGDRSIGIVRERTQNHAGGSKFGEHLVGNGSEEAADTFLEVPSRLLLEGTEKTT
jgi:hypothetical protein